MHDRLRAENEALKGRLTIFNECVRIYNGHRARGLDLRPGWLEEEVDATDALLNGAGPSDEKGPAT